MRECTWMCIYYIGGGGRCGLASVHGCTLACMYALLHAGCRTGGLGENMRMPDIKVYNPHITMYIERGTQLFRRILLVFVWLLDGGSDKEHKAHGFMAMRDRWIGRCSSNGGSSYCRDDKSAGTA